MNKTRRLEVRYAWIEASLRYSGRFDKVSYGDHHGINPPQISSDQTNFTRAFNYELAHRERQKALSDGGPYIEIKKGKIAILRELPAKAVFDVPSPREWLRTLTTIPYVEAHSFCADAPAQAVLSALCGAIIREAPLKVIYEDAQDRFEATISPHSIIDVVGRLYARAYDHASEEFRDFKINDIQEVLPPEGKVRFASPDADTDWHETVDLQLLSPGRNAAIDDRDPSPAAAELHGGVVSAPRALTGYLKRYAKTDT